MPDRTWVNAFFPSPLIFRYHLPLILFFLAVPGREVHHPERHRDPALQVLAAHPAGALRPGGGSRVLVPDPEWIRFQLDPWSRIQEAKVVIKKKQLKCLACKNSLVVWGFTCALKSSWEV